MYCVCADLAHTGAAYSATEYHKSNASVLIVLAFVPTSCSLMFSPV